MNSYFPYDDKEWESIVEQAFSPDAFEPKFSKAYQRRKRRMERKMLKKPMSLNRRICCVAAAVSAAVLCVFFGASVATSTSLEQGISDFFHGAPTKEKPIQSITVEPAEIETSANTPENFTIQNEASLTYFDGTYLKITLCLSDLPESLQDSTSVVTSITATLGSKPLTFPEIAGPQEINQLTGYPASLSEQAAGKSKPEDITLAVFSLCNDGKYRTDLLAEYPDQATETLPLCISFSYFQGINERELNAYAYNEDGSVCYEAAALGTVAANVSYQTDIVCHTDHVQQYDIHETKNNCTLKSIRISPVCTRIEMEGKFAEDDTLSVLENGAVYCDFIDVPTKEPWDYHCTLWQPPGAAAQELRVYLLHHNMHPSDESSPDAAFVVPIQSVPQLPSKTTDQSPAELEHIYDPPLTTP